MGVVFVNSLGLYCGNWVISLSWSTRRVETCITLSKNFTLNTVVYLVVIPDTGDTVRVQPNHLSFTSAAALRDMHGFKVVPVKAGIYKNLFQPPGVVDRESFLGTLFDIPWLAALRTRNRQYHDKFRHIFGTSFSNTALVQNIEPTMRSYLNNIMRLVEEKSKEGDIDISPYCKYFAFDVFPPSSQLLSPSFLHIMHMEVILIQLSTQNTGNW